MGLLALLVGLELVLGVDNVLVIAILSDGCPRHSANGRDLSG